ncbi:hypothetical protein HPB50_008464 [Hyalomma asiaticum]|uniref:Uncharacterized protein n=1 Tax=Hyalomma asiaticum TaxID=266040 RepID=A0ACB7SMA5_HYAAI|nr:hypothetical protein HPB50_008464 [Hyalomma asiaticum]
MATERFLGSFISPDKRRQKMLHSMWSGVELLLRSHRCTSPVHNLRKPKITMMVAARLRTKIVSSVALGVALRPCPERQVDFSLKHPAMALLAGANISDITHRRLCRRLIGLGFWTFWQPRGPSWFFVFPGGEQ